jgi:type I restriction enzyme S subunit
MRESRQVETTAGLIKMGALEIGDGYRAKNVELAGEGLPFLRVRNVREGYFDLRDVDFFPEDALQRVGRKVSRVADCVIATKGTVGRVAFVSVGDPQVVYSPQVSYWRVIDPSVLDPRFLRYWLQGSEFVNQCWQMKRSTDMADYINLNDQRQMRITLPAIDEQRRIAAVLFAYDDLIENHTRRIAILEELGRRIYEEWFVNLRFPGHEPHGYVSVDGPPLPSEWGICRLFDAADVTYGYPLKSKFFSELPEGRPVIRIRDIPKGRSATFTSEVIDPRYEVENGDVLVGMDGDFHVCIWAGGNSYLNQRVARLRPKDGFTTLHLYLALQKPIAELNATITGTTVAHLLDSHLRALTLARPSDPILDMGRSLFDPISDLQLNLKVGAHALRQTRDLLLPKLISGEFDVSDLDLDMREDVA